MPPATRKCPATGAGHLWQQTAYCARRMMHRFTCVGCYAERYRKPLPVWNRS